MQLTPHSDINSNNGGSYNSLYWYMVRHGPIFV